MALDVTTTHMVERVDDRTYQSIEEPVADEPGLPLTPTSQLLLERRLGFLKHFRDLNARRTELRTDIVKMFEERSLIEYEALTSVRGLALKGANYQPDDTREFRRMSMALSFSLERFNAPNTIWQPFVSDAARAVSKAEKNYIVEAIVGSTSTFAKITRENPEIGVMEDAVTELRSLGKSSKLILDPHTMIPEFFSKFGDRFT
jgi:hypothetical protein